MSSRSARGSLKISSSCTLGITRACTPFALALEQRGVDAVHGDLDAVVRRAWIGMLIAMRSVACQTLRFDARRSGVYSRYLKWGVPCSNFS